MWGPLIFTLILSVVLSLTAGAGQMTTMFTGTFTLVTFGGSAVAINFLLLGGTIGFFSAICALGYCLAPICVASLLSIIPIFIIRLIVCPCCLYWSYVASRRFFHHHIHENKRILGMYPVVLFYSILSWIVFIH